MVVGGGVVLMHFGETHRRFVLIVSSVPFPNVVLSPFTRLRVYAISSIFEKKFFFDMTFPGHCSELESAVMTWSDQWQIAIGIDQ